MLPIGLLMREHRLIGRMVLLVKKELQRSKKSLKIDTEFIRISIDFFKIYADLTHHGKEEEILFKALGKKNLTEDHIKILNRLLNDHKIAREPVRALEKMNNEYAQGYHTNIEGIQEKLQKLVTLYPQHITIEDTEFFFPAMNYFTVQESDAMLQKFYHFDKTVIHEHYYHLVETLEKESSEK
jgi:hemerythrin-like domain-containing protein